MSHDVTYHVDVAGRSFTLTSAPPARSRTRALPVWTELAHHRCDACPLSADTERCPAAVALVPLLDAAADLRSTDRASVRVVSEEREVHKDTDLQEALRSVLGLVLSTSGCPVLGALSPLAKHHLPFSSPEETLFRVASLFALRDRFGALKGASWIDEMRALYAQLGAVNRALAARVRDAASGDASVNALVQLFSLGMIVEDELESNLDELKQSVTAALG